jgi:hypothetical protein
LGYDSPLARTRQRILMTLQSLVILGSAGAIAGVAAHPSDNIGYTAAEVGD